MTKKEKDYQKKVGTTPYSSSPTPKKDSLDEWVNWRGRIVKRWMKDYNRFDPVHYVVVGGNAADALRPLCFPEYRKKKYLVLVPLTRDTDEDSFTVAKRSELEFV